MQPLVEEHLGEDGHAGGLVKVTKREVEGEGAGENRRTNACGRRQNDKKRDGMLAKKFYWLEIFFFLARPFTKIRP